MFDANENDPISPAMRALLEVFSTELSEVKFPDVDAEVLEEAAAPSPSSSTAWGGTSSRWRWTRPRACAPCRWCAWTEGGASTASSTTLPAAASMRPRM